MRLSCRCGEARLDRRRHRHGSCASFPPALGSPGAAPFPPHADAPSSTSLLPTTSLQHDSRKLDQTVQSHAPPLQSHHASRRSVVSSPLSPADPTHPLCAAPSHSQFHPESVCTQHGATLLRNFFAMAAESAPRPAHSAPPAGITCEEEEQEQGARPSGGWHVRPGMQGLRVLSRAVQSWADPQVVYKEMFRGDDDSYWLDTARQQSETGRFSFMGGSDGPLSYRLSYRVGSSEVVEMPGGAPPDAVKVHRGTRLLPFVEARLADSGRIPPCHAAPRPFSVDRIPRAALPSRDLEFFLTRVPSGCLSFVFLVLVRAATAPPQGLLPFEFCGGFVGYLGYEMKEECFDMRGERNAHVSGEPDAKLLFSDRFIAWDHLEGRSYLVALCNVGLHDEQMAWIDSTETRWDPSVDLNALKGSLPISQISYARGLCVCVCVCVFSFTTGSLRLPRRPPHPHPPPRRALSSRQMLLERLGGSTNRRGR